MRESFYELDYRDLPTWVIVHYWITAWGDEWQAQEDWLAETDRLEELVENLTLAAMPPGMVN